LQNGGPGINRRFAMGNFQATGYERARRLTIHLDCNQRLFTFAIYALEAPSQGVTPNLNPVGRPAASPDQANAEEVRLN